MKWSMVAMFAVLCIQQVQINHLQKAKPDVSALEKKVSQNHGFIIELDNALTQTIYAIGTE